MGPAVGLSVGTHGAVWAASGATVGVVCGKYGTAHNGVVCVHPVRFTGGPPVWFAGVPPLGHLMAPHAGPAGWHHLLALPRSRWDHCMALSPRPHWERWDAVWETCNLRGIRRGQ